MRLPDEIPSRSGKAEESAPLQEKNVRSVSSFAPPYECQSMKRGSFGEFHRSLNTTLHGYSVVEDPTGSAPTLCVERFEVRHGDCGRDENWSDCDSHRERSELSEQGDRQKSGSTHWYTWSLYLDGGYPTISPAKVAFGQFHQVGAKPAWMFQQNPCGYVLDRQVCGETQQCFPLIDAKDLRGRWHRIVVQAHWSKTKCGFFRVWVNDTKRVCYSGATMTAEIVYFKYGLYRSFLDRFAKAHPGTDTPTQTVLYANVRRARRRSEL